MSTIPDKTLAIRVDEEFYKRVRIRLAEKGMTLKDYFVSLVNADIDSSGNDLIEGYTVAEILAQADKISTLLQKIAEK